MTSKAIWPRSAGIIPICVAATFLASAVTAVAQQRPTPSPRPAQPPTTRDLVGNRGTYADLDRRVAMERLLAQPKQATLVFAENSTVAGCIVRLGGDRAGSLLGGPGTSDPAFGKLSKAMAGRYARCAPDGEVGSLSPSILNAAIAENLVRRSAGEIADRTPAVDVDRAAAFHGPLTGQITFDAVARCAVVYSTGLARKVLDTKPGSSEEASSLATLFAQSPECQMTVIPPSVPPLFQRTSVAASLYAWTHRAEAP
jgi:hypothetical protein